MNTSQQVRPLTRAATLLTSGEVHPAGDIHTGRNFQMFWDEGEVKLVVNGRPVASVLLHDLARYLLRMSVDTMMRFDD